jgi:hypothetical protein
MGVSDEAKNVIPLKFLRKIKNKNFCPLVNSIRGHTVYSQNFFLAVQHSCLSLKIISLQALVCQDCSKKFPAIYLPLGICIVKGVFLNLASK